MKHTGIVFVGPTWRHLSELQDPITEAEREATEGTPLSFIRKWKAQLSIVDLRWTVSHLDNGLSTYPLTYPRPNPRNQAVSYGLTVLTTGFLY